MVRCRNINIREHPRARLKKMHRETPRRCARWRGMNSLIHACIVWVGFYVAPRNSKTALTASAHGPRPKNGTLYPALLVSGAAGSWRRGHLVRHWLNLHPSPPPLGPLHPNSSTIPTFGGEICWATCCDSMERSKVVTCRSPTECRGRPTAP